MAYINERKADVVVVSTNDDVSQSIFRVVDTEIDVASTSSSLKLKNNVSGFRLDGPVEKEARVDLVQLLRVLPVGDLGSGQGQQRKESDQHLGHHSGIKRYY